jgi:hypothetical protein
MTKYGPMPKVWFCLRKVPQSLVDLGRKSDLFRSKVEYITCEIFNSCSRSKNVHKRRNNSEGRDSKDVGGIRYQLESHMVPTTVLSLVALHRRLNDY